MKVFRLSLLLLAVALLLLPASATAQTYYFSLDQDTVNVYLNDDGSASIDYILVFTNDPSSGPIDYVDLGIPHPDFVENSISADVDGKPVTDISKSGFQGQGYGVAVGLGKYAIKPGKTGTVHIFVGTINNVLYTDSKDPSGYASAVFSPAYFVSSIVHGKTNTTMTFHLPPGIKPDEPRWHTAPSGFPAQPVTGLDNDGRVVYEWNNPNAKGDTLYKFGASFPSKYVPAAVIKKPSIWESLGISEDTFFGVACCGGFALLIGFIVWAGIKSSEKRKLQYLPPRIAIEGHGIKRGLTAVEAAILLEEPLDKIMTMILFAVIKKGAASVKTRDPLELDFVSPLPEGLLEYETKFLDAFRETQKAARRKALQDMTITLVQSISQKMKGFSRQETVAYYRDIMKRAWAQVEAANTPEVKSQKYDEVMEWTMLDRHYDEHTRDVFRTGPVFVPIWWSRYDPSFGRGTVSVPSSVPGSAPTFGPTGGIGGGVSLPHLPGSDFAASMVHGVQNFSSSVIGNVTEFTSSITNKTNPVPVATTSSRSGGGFRGGGGGCACACAGCACACAGGGR